MTLDVNFGLLDVEGNCSVDLRDQIGLVCVLRYLSLTAFLVDPHVPLLVRLVHLLRKLNLSSRVSIVEVLHRQLLVSVAVLPLFQISFT